MEDPPVNRFFHRLKYNVRVLIYGYLDIPGKDASGLILSCRQAYDEAVSETQSRLLRLMVTVKEEIKHDITLAGLKFAVRLSQLRDIRINISYSKAFDARHVRHSLTVLWRRLKEFHIRHLTTMFEGDSYVMYSPHDQLQFKGETRALVRYLAEELYC